MSCAQRPDDFESRREHLRALSDEELHAHFWKLVEGIVAPLVDEARTHTTPARTPHETVRALTPYGDTHS